MTKGSRKRRKVKHNSITHWVTPQIPDDLLIDIPEDLLIEILNRLPAKSVMRFKCMSKFWSSLLSSRYFCNRYLTVIPSSSSTPHQLPRLYISLIDRLSDYSTSLLLSSSRSSSSSSSALVFNKTLSKMGGFSLRILRGFICFTVNQKPRIYNPTTRQLVILPAISASDLIAEQGSFNTSSFICHDPIHDQYKILCIISKTSSNGFQNIRSEHWVYLLEAGGSWKKVAKEFPHHHLSNPRELTMDGVLYYFAWTHSSTCVLVSFDMSSEEFNMIQLSHIPGNWRRKTPINYHGKVAVFDFTSINVTGSVDLWILEDWRKEEWLKKTLVILQPSQMHLLGVAGNRFIPKSTTLKSKVILIPERLIYPFYILCYDLETNHLKNIRIKGIRYRWFLKPHDQIYFDLEFMDVTESILYLET